MATEMRKSGENNPYFVSDIYVLFLDRENLRNIQKRLVEKQHPENSKICQKKIFFSRKTRKKFKAESKEVFRLH